MTTTLSIAKCMIIGTDTESSRYLLALEPYPGTFLFKELSIRHTGQVDICYSIRIIFKKAMTTIRSSVLVVFAMASVWIANAKPYPGLSSGSESDVELLDMKALGDYLEILISQVKNSMGPI